jgi:hypothetical protein
VIAKAGIVDEILTLNVTKTHTHREMDIAGIKVGDGPVEEFYRCRDIGEVARRVTDRIETECTYMYGVEYRRRRDLNTSEMKNLIVETDRYEKDEVDGLYRMTKGIDMWRSQRHFLRLYKAGSVANQSVLCRIYAFQAVQKKKFWWTEKLKTMAAHMLNISTNER